eukprot:scaffold537_cov180-Ochromonas_danica.AAC.70
MGYGCGEKVCPQFFSLSDADYNNVTEKFLKQVTYSLQCSALTSQQETITEYNQCYRSDSCLIGCPFVSEVRANEVEQEKRPFQAKADLSA